MAKAVHLSDADLILFADTEMRAQRAAAIDAHLQNCALCRDRLAKLQTGVASYEQYHEQILRPSLELPQAEWPRLQFPHSVKAEKRFSFSPILWGAGAVLACCLLVVAVYFYRDSPQQQMRQVLARAVTAPAPLHRRIQLTMGQRRWYRPAVLRRQGGDSRSMTPSAGLEQVQLLFVEANYSWDDPLSAQSFAAWRDRLHEKRDQVTSVQSDDGSSHFYRVRTETSQGVLRTASLTLRADTFSAVKGAFEFENREKVEMADSGEMPESAPVPAARQSAPAVRGGTTETKASPEDELRVFAALHAIGADVGEAVSVDIDPARQRVLITGMGIPVTREREIREAVAGVPKAMARFDSAREEHREPAPGANAGAYVTNLAAPVRQMLEDRAGGAQQLQSLTDRTLDASNSILAQTHALYVLAERFPVDVETGFVDSNLQILRKLQRDHAVAIQQATLQLSEALNPLLGATASTTGTSAGMEYQPRTPWQAGAARMLELARELDQSVSRLLGGNDSQQIAEDTLSRLPNEIQKLETLARLQAAE